MDTTKLNLLSHAMLAYRQRMEAISGNIANLDTPGYRKVSVSFEDRLQQVMHGPNGAEAGSQVGPRYEMSDQAPVLEDELMDMADTQMRTQVAARALHEHFGLMRTAITGRSG